MTSKKELAEIQGEVLKLLKEKLSSDFSYHSYEHTLDVLQATERIAKAENVSAEELQLLKIAAVLHDTGYIYSWKDHEQKSCSVAKSVLSSNGIDNSTIMKVCNLIMATMYPPNPKNKLEEILCDADLDYLGRDDYFKIAPNVFKEFKKFGIVDNDADWRDMQIKFLESHRYFTKTSNESRNEKKLANLAIIKNGK